MRGIPFTATAIICFLSASMSAGQDASVPRRQPLRPKRLNPGSGLRTQRRRSRGSRPRGPPLAVGPARFRVGGYLGVTGIYRSTNSGGGIGTSFATIPYEDKVQGNVSETRLSAQSSRLSLRVDADFPETEARFRRLVGLFRNGLRWDDAGHRGGHEHQRRLSPPPGVR